MLQSCLCHVSSRDIHPFHSMIYSKLSKSHKTACLNHFWDLLHIQMPFFTHHRSVDSSVNIRRLVLLDSSQSKVHYQCLLMIRILRLPIQKPNMLIVTSSSTIVFCWQQPTKTVSFTKTLKSFYRLRTLKMGFKLSAALFLALKWRAKIIFQFHSNNKSWPAWSGFIKLEFCL